MFEGGLDPVGLVATKLSPPVLQSPVAVAGWVRTRLSKSSLIWQMSKKMKMSLFWEKKKIRAQNHYLFSPCCIGKFSGWCRLLGSQNSAKETAKHKECICSVFQPTNNKIT